MQDPYQQIRPPQFLEHEQLKCPRCDSNNTKFCYYNNYNLSQPRHFCKNCRRYWTKGGALRNIPVGGGSRKNTKRVSNQKRSSSSSSSSAVVGAAAAAAAVPSSSADKAVPSLERPGAYFSALLAGNSQLGNLLEGLNPHGSGVGGLIGEHPSSDSDPGLIRNTAAGLQSGAAGNSESFLGGDSSCWGGGNGGLILPFTGQVRPFGD
ncbi:hypothetical protein NMG60_11004145 [Bertholletia excelsa]